MTPYRLAAILPFVCALCAVMLLSGCGKQPISSSPPPKPGAYKPSKPSKPYTIKGETYYPIATPNGFTEEGLASWYGKDFHGNKTANGEVYDMYAMTAAHKLLPFNTVVRVYNLDNGLQTDVRVNDRGPFVKGRIIDLSYTAAKKLGVVGPGTARVKVASLSHVPGYEPENNNFYGEFYVQIGSYTVQGNAQAQRHAMQAAGYTKNRITPAVVGGKRFWRVQIGPYLDLQSARDAQSHLSSSFPSCFVIAD